MVTILSVFTSTSFKEIRLPNLVNTDFSFKLFKDIFHLSQDMEIHLENIDGVWQFTENKLYSVLKGNVRFENKPVSDQDIFHVVTKESENVTITLDKASVPMGGSVVYTIEAQAGYTVTTVSLNGMDVTDKIVLANGVYTYTARGIVEDVKLIVTVEAKTYTVSVTAGEGGSVTPDTASVVANGSVVLTVTENDGYQLKSLTVNGKSVSLGVDGTYTVKNVLENVTVVAEFEKIVTNVPDSTSNGSASSDTNASSSGCGSIAGLGAASCLLLSVAALIVIKRKDNDLE
jgi:hypothetical protein